MTALPRSLLLFAVGLAAGVYAARLFAPRRPELPIYVSAVFPKGIALCGEIADGIILTRSTVRTAAEMRRHLAEGAARAGRDPAAITVTSLLPTAVADSREEALALLRPGLAFYAGFFPRYNRMMADYAAKKQSSNGGMQQSYEPTSNSGGNSQSK